MARGTELASKVSTKSTKISRDYTRRDLRIPLQHPSPELPLTSIYKSFHLLMSEPSR